MMNVIARSLVPARWRRILGIRRELKEHHLPWNSQYGPLTRLTYAVYKRWGVKHGSVLTDHGTRGADLQ